MTVLKQNMKRPILKACFSSALLSIAISQHAVAQDEPEEVVVYGIKQAIETALESKRENTAIMDSINATDIGTLPDNNVAEALQRVPGIQVVRDNTGEGNGFQIRGITENRIELEGRAILPDNAGNRRASTRNIPSTIIAGLDVFKSQSADMTEGSLGGTVVVRTRKPLDTGLAISGNIGFGQDSDLSETDPKYSFLISNNWDFGDTGRFGALLNVSSEEYHESSHQMQAPDWQGWFGTNRANLCDTACETALPGLESTFHAVPQLYRIQQPFEERERTGIDAIFQWEINEQFEVGLHLNQNNFNTINSQQRTVVPIRQNGFQRLDETEDMQIQTVTRNAFADEFADMEGTTPYNGTVSRSFILKAAVDASRPRFAMNFADVEREQTNNAIYLKYTGDTVTVDAQYSSASSEVKEQNYNFQISTNDGLIGDLPKNHPTLFYDFTRGGEHVVLDYNFDDLDNRPDDGVGAGFDANGNDMIDPEEVYGLTNLNSLAFQFMNSTTAPFGPGQTQDEDAFKVDVDWDIDAGPLASIEAGFRMSSLEVNQYRYRFQGHNLNVQTPFIDLPQRVQDFFVMDPDPVVPDAKGSFLRTWFSPQQPQTFDRIKEVTDLAVEGSNELRAAENLLREAQNETIRMQNMGLPEDQQMDEIALLPILNNDRVEEFSAFYNIQEDTTAAYVKFNFEGELGSLPFRADVGVRHVSTDVTSLGADTVDPMYTRWRKNGDPRPILTLESNYSEFLPSATISMDLQDDLILRFHGSKRLARADLSDLAPNLGIDVINTRGTRGNPGLQPKTSVNFDSSLEWYFADDAMLSGTIFYVDLSSFFDTAYLQEPYISADTMMLEDFTIEQKVNGPSGKTQGFELNFQQGWAYGFGGQINFTYADSSQPDNFRDELTGQVLPLLNTSETSYNVVLYWENYGFEARMAYNWRDERFSGNGPGTPDPITYSPQINNVGETTMVRTPVALPKYWEAYGQLDMSLGYNWGENVTVRLTGRNVLDNYERQYIGISQALNELKYTGSRWELSITGRY